MLLVLSWSAAPPLRRDWPQHHKEPQLSKVNFEPHAQVNTSFTTSTLHQDGGHTRLQPARRSFRRCACLRFRQEAIQLTHPDTLHKERLLKVEVRPFDRVARKILARDSHLYIPRTALPTPPPDSNAIDEDAAAHSALLAKQLEDRRQWREEMLLDFAALEDSMVRIQLLRRSNDAERARYAAEKVKILSTAAAIRENTTELRAQLDVAQRTLALRKTYDALADRITGNRMLKPREEQAANLEKLDKEIGELEGESKAYAATWAERRTQFQRIVEEGKQMLRMIRDEKEEAERKEGMEENSEAGGSRAGTPTPQDGGRTPAQTEQDAGTGSLRPLPKDLLAPEGGSSERNSRASSPGGHSQLTDVPNEGDGTSQIGEAAEDADVREGSPLEEGQDTAMGEAHEIDDGEEDGEVEASPEDTPVLAVSDQPPQDTEME